ncbi:MAG: SufE family protein [Alkalispirochaetaceae bacterium]
MKTVEEAKAYLEEITDELVTIREMDNLEMYRMLTDIGKKMAELPEEEKTPENFVYGCVSNVYVSDEIGEDGAIYYRGSSESHIVRGYLAILIEALSGLPPADVANETKGMVESFARDTDLKATLTPNRANAFGNIYQLMVDKAKAAA